MYSHTGHMFHTQTNNFGSPCCVMNKSLSLSLIDSTLRMHSVVYSIGRVAATLHSGVYFSWPKSFYHITM